MSVPRSAVLIAVIAALVGLAALFYAVRYKPAQQAATIDEQYKGLSAPGHRGQARSLRPGNQ